MQVTFSERIDNFFSAKEAKFQSKINRKAIALTGCLVNSIIVLAETIGFIASSTFLVLRRFAAGISSNFRAVQELSARIQDVNDYETQAIRTIRKQFARAFGFEAVNSPITSLENYREYLSDSVKQVVQQLLSQEHENLLQYLADSTDLKEEAKGSKEEKIDSGREQLASQMCYVQLSLYTQYKEILGDKCLAPNVLDERETNISKLRKKVQNLSEAVKLDLGIRLLAQNKSGLDENVSAIYDSIYKLSAALIQGPLMTVKKDGSVSNLFALAYQKALKAYQV